MPAANDDAFSTQEDVAVSGNLAANDMPSTDGGNVWALAEQAASGTALVNADGTFTYTPNANFNGSDTFAYKITDVDGSVSTATVSITVAALEDLTGADDSFSVNEDATLSASVAGNDETTSGGTLSYAVATDVSNGTLSFNADGSFDYTPDANFNGSDSFTYTVTDAASGESDTQTVSITVDAVEDLTYADDSFTVNEDETLSASIAANDETTSGGTLSYAVATDVSNGTLSLNADGSFDYTPDSNFNGSDSFTYTVTDAASGESDTQTVSITVDPVEDLTGADDSFTVNEDETLSASVAGNDATTSGGTLAYAVATDVSNGTLSFNADGSFDYTPDANFNGSDSFTYSVTDAASGESDTRTVLITIQPVNDVPLALSDAFSVFEDAPLSGDLAANDTPSSEGGNVWALGDQAASGTAVVNADGTFTYTPNGNFNGSDSCTYTITDVDGDVSTATVTVGVNSVNDAPHLIGPAAAAGEEGVPVVIAGITFADIDGAAGNELATFTVDSGALTATSSGGVTVTGSGTSTLTLSGSIASLNAFIAGSQLSYMGLAGTHNLHATLSDEGNSGSGGALADSIDLPIILAGPSNITRPPTDGDFDGDQHGDLFLFKDTEGAIWLMDESVRIGTGTNLPDNGPSWHARTLADLDPAGGSSEIVWQNDNGLVATWKMQGTSVVEETNLGNPGAAVRVEDANDFNQDGAADILLQNDDGRLSLWLMQDSAHVLEQVTIAQNPGAPWDVVATGDFDGDGRAGILFQGPNGQTAMWEGFSETAPGQGQFNLQTNLQNNGPTWHVKAAGDFDNDGKDDIVWQKTAVLPPSG